MLVLVLKFMSIPHHAEHWNNALFSNPIENFAMLVSRPNSAALEVGLLAVAA